MGKWFVNAASRHNINMYSSNNIKYSCLVDKGMSCKEKAKGIADLNLIGSFVPKCEPDGTYSPLQCHASTGICWCADKFGDVVPQNLIRGTKCGKFI